MLKKVHKQLIRTRKPRGDLMIEVLIALAVISVVLMGGFAISHRSLDVSNNADLRSQAQSLAQGQIERMINTQNTQPVELSRYTIDRPFCIMPDGQINDANTNAQVCPNYDNQANIGVGVVYDDNTKVFTVRGKWNITSGDPLKDPAKLAYKDNVTLYYRLPIDFSSDSLALNVYLRGSGQGSVTGSGINCSNIGAGSASCSKAYASSQSEILVATAGPNSKFTNWGGDCSGTTSTCSVFVNRIMYVTAMFDSLQPPACQPVLQTVNENPDGFVPPSVDVHINLKTGCQKLINCYVEFGQARGVMNWGTSICGLHSDGLGYNNNWESQAWVDGSYHGPIATAIGRAHSSGSGRILANGEKVYYRYCANNGGGAVCEPSYRCAQMDSVPNDGKHDGRAC